MSESLRPPTGTPTWLALLSLAPLLGASENTLNALAMALVGAPVLILFCAARALLQPWLTSRTRLPATVLLTAALVSCAQLALQALSLELHRALGIYVGLLALHCLLLDRSEALLGLRPWRAIVQGARLAASTTLFLLLLGVLREALTHGTLLGQMDGLFGAAARPWTLHLWPAGVGLTGLLPGALLLLGLLLAAYNALATSRTPPGQSDAANSRPPKGSSEP